MNVQSHVAISADGVPIHYDVQATAYSVRSSLAPAAHRA
jgi:hypothetical protein